MLSLVIWWVIILIGSEQQEDYRRNPLNVEVEKMVRPERFELPTFWFVARRSIQLSYERTVCFPTQIKKGSKERKFLLKTAASRERDSANEA